MYHTLHYLGGIKNYFISHYNKILSGNYMPQFCANRQLTNITIFKILQLKSPHQSPAPKTIYAAS